MAIKHAQPGDVVDARPLGDQLARTTTHALIKTRSLELMRIVLRAGQALPPHSVYGEATIQCIEGRVRVQAEVGSCELGAGQLVLLPAQDLHGVQALVDTSLLVTVQLPPGKPGSASSTG